MQFIKRIGLVVLLGMCCAGAPGMARAQANKAVEARQLAAEKNYDKAIPIYEELFSIAPDSVYTEYLAMLLESKKYKIAEKVVEKQMTLRDNQLLHIDLGRVYELAGKDGKAKDQYEMALAIINGDDMLTQRVAKAFTTAGKDNYAIAAYERATQLLGNPYVYSGPLATLHARSGNLEKAIDALLAGNAMQYMNLDNAKALLLELLGSDQQKLVQAQKILVKQINEHPENTYLAELLTWIYTQKNDWEGALIQIEAVDARNNEEGRRLMQFAHTARTAKQYDIALKAYTDIVEKGSTLPLYIPAKNEMLNVALTRLENDHAYKPEDVTALVAQYEAFLTEFPNYYTLQPAADYAMLQAQYNNNVAKGIEILKKSLAMPETRRVMAGQLKLQLGDYYLLAGKLWDASLAYSQVDKEFKQDVMGEDARFRNAKLAYYRGDLDWAQRQLSVLKASTSQLIANDALYLSVLITENVEDSNTVPLQRFANAGLLLAQNKDAETEKLLDSIASEYPKHPLNDDMLLLRAEIAMKHRDYTKALGYLKNIYEQYGKDVLGDDAVFRTAEIYHEFLHQNDKAKEFYEQLIIDYMGSTYVQTARQRLAEMNNVVTP